MPTLITIEEFEDELDALVQANPDDGGLIDALIEDLGADSAMLETLCDEVPKWHYMFTRRLRSSVSRYVGRQGEGFTY